MPRQEIATPAGPAWADLDRPRRAVALLVLTHGAGGGVETTDLLAVRAAALEVGVAVALVTQPYRVGGRRTPPVPARQDEAWLAVVAALRRGRGAASLPLFVGGRSNGARVACRTATASGAAGVVALAFPLHPPGRPHASSRPLDDVRPAKPMPTVRSHARSRLDELRLPSVPVLVVQGDRDPFGLPPRGRGRRVVVVPGADHALRTDPAAVARHVLAFVTSTAARANVEA